MYAQFLIAASFVFAAYQDVKDRAVSDLVWIPALAGVAYVILSFYIDSSIFDLELVLVKVILIGGIAFAFTFLGGIGQADAIALAFIAADPYSISPLPALFATAVVALSHIGYEFAIGNARGKKIIPMAQFLREQRWIPRAVISEGTRTEVDTDVNLAREDVEAKGRPNAMVEVSYGVPTVAYLGVGYVIYIVYMLVFNFSTLARLP